MSLPIVKMNEATNKPKNTQVAYQADVFGFLSIKVNVSISAIPLRAISVSISICIVVSSLPTCSGRLFRLCYEVRERPQLFYIQRDIASTHHGKPQPYPLRCHHRASLMKNT